MKNFAYLLTVLLISGAATVANAQTNPKSQAPKSAAKIKRDSTPDYYMMVDGKMMKMQGGQTMPMTENATMSDGSMCMTDGTCKMKDGSTMMLKNGQCVTKDGKMTTMSAMKKGGKMKSGSMGNMKM
jgi:hypothetical protein